jgi:hypothetical protein
MSWQNVNACTGNPGKKLNVKRARLADAKVLVQLVRIVVVTSAARKTTLNLYDVYRDPPSASLLVLGLGQAAVEAVADLSRVYATLWKVKTSPSWLTH